MRFIRAAVLCSNSGVTDMPKNQHITEMHRNAHMRLNMVCITLRHAGQISYDVVI